MPAADSARSLRADAQLNHDRLVEAAGRVFARDGPDASLKAIAQEAGVGIGTLYRRFPTREALVEATYRSETERLCAAAPDLLDRLPPTEALREWMDGFVEYLAAKHGMADALQAVLVARGEEAKLRTRDAVAAAIGALLQAGISDGSLRPDADPRDVMFAVGGVAMVTEGEVERRMLVSRLLDLILAGLRTS